MVLDNQISNDPPQKKINFILQLFNSNKLIEAKKEIDQQLRIYKKSSVLFNILGAVLAGQNKLEEAFKSYSKLSEKEKTILVNNSYTLYSSVFSRDKAIIKINKLIREKNCY